MKIHFLIRDFNFKIIGGTKLLTNCLSVFDHFVGLVFNPLLPNVPF